MVHVKKPGPIAVQGPFHIVGSWPQFLQRNRSNLRRGRFDLRRTGWVLPAFAETAGMPGSCFRLQGVVDQGSPAPIRDAEMPLNAMQCSVHWFFSYFCLWMVGSISFRRAQLPTWALLPAKTCCPGSSHVHLESCTSDVFITREHQPSRPGPRKHEVCHDHRMPHPKVFGPRMPQAKCTSLDMQTSHGGAADQKALSVIARRSMEADVARNTSEYRNCQDTRKDLSSPRTVACQAAGLWHRPF